MSSLIGLLSWVAGLLAVIRERTRLLARLAPFFRSATSRHCRWTHQKHKIKELRLLFTGQPPDWIGQGMHSVPFSQRVNGQAARSVIQDPP